MIPRTAGRSLNRIASSSVAGSSRLAARHLSSAIVRPSNVALGKRPFVPLAGAVPVRHLSWTPWRREVVPETTVSSASSSSTVPSNTSLPSLDAASSPIAPAVVDAPPLPAPAPTSAPVDAAASSTSTPPAAPAADLASTGVDLTATPIHTLSDATLGDLIRMNPDVPTETLLRSPEAISAVVTKADLALIGLEHRFYSTIGWTVDALNSLHNMTGLPWWLTIAAFVGFIRLFIFRTVINVNKNNVKLQAIQPQMLEIQRRMKDATARKDQAEAQQCGLALQSLLKTHQVNPLKALQVPLMQFPIFISMFYGLQRMAAAPLPGFLEGGFGWVRDLTVADPYYILPLTSVALTNWVIRIGADGTGGVATGQNDFMRHAKNLLAVLSVPTFFFIQSYPAAVLFYWTTTNLFTLAQAYTMKSVGFKRWAGIPPPPVLPKIPGAVNVSANPSMKETWDWLRGSAVDRYATARDKAAADQQAALDAQQKRQKQIGGVRNPGMGDEIIRERRR